MVSHHDDGGLDLFDVGAVRLGVLRQRQVHLLLDADVVDDQSLLLVLKLPVHPRDRLDQIVPLDRLVDVDGIEEGHVKARQPHVHHDGDFEIGFRLLELGIELLALVLVAEQIVERFSSSLPRVITILMRSIGRISFFCWSLSSTPSAQTRTSAHSGRSAMTCL